MKAMVLAAGLGTRLRPLTEQLPKPLVPFLGRSLLDRALDGLAAIGITDVAVNASWMADAMERHLGNRPELRPRVWVSREERPLGTGGGLAAVRSWLAGAEFLVINGDIVFDCMDVGAVVAAHRSVAADATLLVIPGERVSPALRKVRLSSEGVVRQLDGVPPLVDPLAPDESVGAYGCVTVAGDALLNTLPARGASCLKEDGFWSLLRGGGRLRAHRAVGPWRDLGTVEDYLKGHADALSERLGSLPILVPWAIVERTAGVWLSPDASVHPSAALRAPCVVGPGARVEPRAVVGPYTFLDRGVHVRSGVVLENVVAWPDSMVSEPAAGVVYTPLGLTCFEAAPK